MTGDDARTPADSGTLRSPKSTGEPSETTPTAGNLSGTGQLIRLALRRDRLVLPLWIVVVVLLTTAGAGAYEQLYPDPAERRVALARLKGVEDRCWVRVAGHERVLAIADEDLERENEEKTSSVHFLRFELSEPMRAAGIMPAPTLSNT